MSCWTCPECRMKNCDRDDCQNPKCPSHKKKEKPLFPDFVEVDTFPAKGDTFEAFIEGVQTRIAKGPNK